MTISEPYWFQSLAHKPIWKQRWCLGTWKKVSRLLRWKHTLGVSGAYGAWTSKISIGMWISLQNEFQSIVVWRKNLTTWQAVLLCPVSSPWDWKHQAYHQHDQHHDHDHHHDHHHYDKIASNAWDGEKFRRIEPLKRLRLLFRAALTISVNQFAALQFVCNPMPWLYETEMIASNTLVPVELPSILYKLWNNWPCFQASGSNVKTKILPCKQMSKPKFYLVSKCQNQNLTL